MNKSTLIKYFFISFVLITTWELLSNQYSIMNILISSPTKIFRYFIENLSSLLSASGITFIESLVGLILATLLAFTIMIICLYSKKFLEFIMPAMIISQVVPIITLAPLIILIFGVGLSAKIVIAALMSFFPIFMNFNTGINNISDKITDMLNIYGAKTTFRIKHIFFPLATPNIMAGLKISSLLSTIGAIVGEFNGADIGLGKNLFLAAKRLEPELMMNSLFFSSLIGLILFSLIIMLELKIGKWYKKSFTTF